ncbi:hypothetical protein [Streptomyces sp. NBC_00470]|uniref:hypothetical protein n=1 Tax=Streptomyces sp. NBC_00470 TaxID=2975753 RepID=UPI0030DE28E3
MKTPCELCAADKSMADRETPEADWYVTMQWTVPSADPTFDGQMERKRYLCGPCRTEKADEFRQPPSRMSAVRVSGRR